MQNAGWLLVRNVRCKGGLLLPKTIEKSLGVFKNKYIRWTNLVGKTGYGYDSVTRTVNWSAQQSDDYLQSNWRRECSGSRGWIMLTRCGHYSRASQQHGKALRGHLRRYSWTILGRLRLNKTSQYTSLIVTSVDEILEGSNSTAFVTQIAIKSRLTVDCGKCSR